MPNKSPNGQENSLVDAKGVLSSLWVIINQKFMGYVQDLQTLSGYNPRRLYGELDLPVSVTTGEHNANHGAQQLASATEGCTQANQ